MSDRTAEPDALVDLRPAVAVHLEEGAMPGRPADLLVGCAALGTTV
ncbi:hypothetical protein [Streptomyces bauhiniae]